VLCNLIFELTLCYSGFESFAILLKSKPVHLHVSNASFAPSLRSIAPATTAYPTATAPSFKALAPATAPSFTALPALPKAYLASLNPDLTESAIAPPTSFIPSTTFAPLDY